MKYGLFIFLFFILLSKGMAIDTDLKIQNSMDSLRLIIDNKENHDTVIYYACSRMTRLTFPSNIDTTIYFWEKAKECAERAQFIKGMKFSYTSLGYFYSQIGAYEEAIDYSFKALDQIEKKGDAEEKTQILNNIGFIYSLQGNTARAIDYYKQSLDLSVELNDLKEVNFGLSNIGSVYSDMGDIPNALTYLNKSLELAEFLGDKGLVSVTLHNIAYIHYDQSNYDLALDFINQSIEIGEEVGNKYYLGPCYSLLGSIYEELEKLDKANVNYLRSYDLKVEIGDQAGMVSSLINLGGLAVAQGDTIGGIALLYQAIEIAEEIENKKGMCESYNSLGQLMYSTGNYDKARDFGNKALKIIPDLGMPQIAVNTYKLMSDVNANANNGMAALEMYQLFVSSRDSIANASNQKLVINQNANYKYEKQKALDDAERNKIEEIERREKKEQKNLMLVIGTGLVITICLLIFVFSRLRITRKQKKVIEEKKKEVESQKAIIEGTHKEITDSINYAQRLQQAILTPFDELRKHLPNNLIFFKPKDVVSGDFYWIEKTKDALYIAVADCTGHGVPGAMVSVVCANALNRSLKEFDLKEPGDILTKTRSLIIDTFSKSAEEVKDGMDIALCKIDQNMITFSGANNPMWIVRDRGFVSNDELEKSTTECYENLALIEFKGDKQAVGLGENSSPFSQTRIEILSGDRVYLFTDGFADQFGGPKGKKYKYRPFKKTILHMSAKPMHEQQVDLDKEFSSWRGSLEQVDDICIIGLEF